MRKYGSSTLLIIDRTVNHSKMAKRKYDPKKASKAIGLKIRAIRNAKGWTLEHCEEMGWPDWTHLQKIEAGKNITVQTLFVRVANLLGVHPAVLFEDV